MSRRPSWRDTSTMRLTPGTWPGWGPSQGPVKYDHKLSSVNLILGLRLCSPGTAWRRRSWTASTWPGPWTGSGTWRTDTTWRGLATTKWRNNLYWSVLSCIFYTLQLLILLAQLIAQWYLLYYLLFTTLLWKTFLWRMHSGLKHNVS